QIHQPAQRSTGIDNVFHQQDVAALELSLRIVQQPDVAARLRRVAVARRDEKIHLQRSYDLAHEIAQKYKTALEQTEHEQLAIGVRARDLGPQLAHPIGNLLLAVNDTPNRATEQARISG